MKRPIIRLVNEVLREAEIVDRRLAREMAEEQMADEAALRRLGDADDAEAE